MQLENKLRPLLAAGKLIQARQTLCDCLACYSEPDASQLAELAYWSCQANDFGFACQLYKQASELAPEHPTYHYNLATTYRILGDVQAAETALSRHLEINPKDGEALWLRCQLGQQTAQTNHLATIERLLSEQMPPKQQVHLLYAKAKSLEDMGQYRQSFQVYQAAAALRRRYLKYNVETDKAIFEHIQQHINNDFYQHASEGSYTEGNIFIVGMPRSGTTLVENILCAHQNVAMGGELNAFSQSLMNEIGKQGDPGSVAAAIVNSVQCDFNAVGQSYQQALCDYRGNNLFVTDKLPINFLYLGLIKKALPGSRILHVSRSPMDTIWSVYKHLFSHAYPFSYDLMEIAKYYLAYRRLMAHWQQLLGDQILHIAYEDLVNDPQVQTRKMAEFCAIDFDPDSLSFYQQQRSVTTGSAVQVQEAVHNRSVEHWKHFADELQPVRTFLHQHGVKTD